MVEYCNVRKCTKGHDDFLSFLVVLKRKTRKIIKVTINFCLSQPYRSVVPIKHISPTHINQHKIIRIDTPVSLMKGKNKSSSIAKKKTPSSMTRENRDYRLLYSIFIVMICENIFHTPPCLL